MRHGSAFGLLFLAFAANCRSVPSTTITPADVAGMYLFERSGKNFGKSWSIRSVLTLEDSGSYELDNTIRTDETNDETEVGTWRIDRHQVVLRNQKGETTDLLVRGDSLVGKVDFPGRLFVRMAGGSPVYVRQRTR